MYQLRGIAIGCGLWLSSCGAAEGAAHAEQQGRASAPEQQRGVGERSPRELSGARQGAVVSPRRGNEPVTLGSNTNWRPLEPVPPRDPLPPDPDDPDDPEPPDDPGRPQAADGEDEQGAAGIEPPPPGTREPGAIRDGIRPPSGRSTAAGTTVPAMSDEAWPWSASSSEGSASSDEQSSASSGSPSPQGTGSSDETR